MNAQTVQEALNLALKDLEAWKAVALAAQAERDALAAQIARLENELRQQKLIHVGFTNEAQVRYVTEENEEGSFYSDTDNECYIPLYMLNIHAHRVGPDSEIYKEHCELWKQRKEIAEIKAQAGRAGYMAAVRDYSEYGDKDAFNQLLADEYAESIRKGGA